MVSRGIEEALAECLERIERGEATVEEAMHLYPRLSSELEPLLRLASELRSMPRISAPESLRTTRRPVFASPRRETPVIDLSSRRWRRPWFRPAFVWAVPLARAAAALLAAFLLLGGTVVASASSLPEEPLYPVKLAVERLQLALAPNPQVRAELEMQFAARRLGEVEAAALQARTEAVRRGLELYEERVSSVLSSVDAANGESDESQQQQTIEDALKHSVEVLEGVVAKLEDRFDGRDNVRAPEAIRAAIERARERAEERVQSGKGARPGPRSEPKPESGAAVPATTGSTELPPTPTGTPVPVGERERPGKAKPRATQLPGPKEGDGPGNRPVVEDDAGQLPPGLQMLESRGQHSPAIGALKQVTPSATPTPRVEATAPSLETPTAVLQATPSREHLRQERGRQRANPRSEEPEATPTP